jgi:hypothetical protein
MRPAARQSRPTLACCRRRRRPAGGGGHRTLHPVRDLGHRHTDRSVRAIAVVDRRAGLTHARGRSVGGDRNRLRKTRPTHGKTDCVRRCRNRRRVRRCGTRGYSTACRAGFSAASGTSMMKTQPLPGILRVLISPPCALTAFRAIESPRPRPDRSLPRRSPNT